MRFPLVAILMLSLVVANSYALGIATDYGSETIKVPITQTEAYYSFRIQNMDDKSVPVLIFVDSDMASLMNESANIIPPKSTGVEFLIRITLPESAGLGDVYNVSYNIKQASTEGGGQVTLGQGIGKSFKVLVVDPSNPDYVLLSRSGEVMVGDDDSFDYTPVGIAVAVFVAVMLAVYFVYRRKAKSQYPYSQ